MVGVNCMCCAAPHQVNFRLDVRGLYIVPVATKFRCQTSRQRLSVAKGWDVPSSTEREGGDALIEREMPCATAAGKAILGESAALSRVLEQIEMVAQTDATVLILGETGVGKELVARAIHATSLRRDRSFVPTTCAAIPGKLFESEFFAHIKEASTAALADGIGNFRWQT